MIIMIIKNNNYTYNNNSNNKNNDYDGQHTSLQVTAVTVIK